jgi:hypothetical protein
MGLYVKIGCARPKSIKQWLLAPYWITHPFWSFEKKLLIILLFSNDLDEDWINYGTFVSVGLYAILNFSVVLMCYFSKFIFFYFSRSRLPKYVIRSTLNIMHEMLIALPLIRLKISNPKNSGIFLGKTTKNIVQNNFLLK